MRSLAEIAGRADADASAVAGCRSMLMGRLGWSGASEAERETLLRFEPVAQAVRAACRPADERTEEDTQAPPPDPTAALRAFEDWYAGARGTPFWMLFEHVMPETPLVDF